jgi:hypothetical protein
LQCGQWTTWADSQNVAIEDTWLLITKLVHIQSVMTRVTHSHPSSAMMMPMLPFPTSVMMTNVIPTHTHYYTLLFILHFPLTTVTFNNPIWNQTNAMIQHLLLFPYLLLHHLLPPLRVRRRIVRLRRRRLRRRRL